MTDAPDFSRLAKSYSESRPGYPPELFAWLAGVTPRREIAWDSATGNGQAAVGLAAHFGRVIATDCSEAQIHHATPRAGVEYRVASAESSGLPAHVAPPFDDVLWPFYRDVVGPHFAAGARLVDDRYEAITLPGTAIEPPRFMMSATWTSREMLRFIQTWSGVQSYIDATGEDPIEALAPLVEEMYGSPDSTRVVRWPVYLRASILR